MLKSVDSRWQSKNLKNEYIGIQNIFVAPLHPPMGRSGEFKKQPPFLGVSERGRDRTCNQWLKRPAVQIRFSHPKAYHFRPIHWTVLKQVSWMRVKVGQHFYVQWTSLPTDELVNFHWGRVVVSYSNFKQMCWSLILASVFLFLEFQILKQVGFIEAHKFEYSCLLLIRLKVWLLVGSSEKPWPSGIENPGSNPTSMAWKNRQLWRF